MPEKAPLPSATVTSAATRTVPATPPLPTPSPAPQLERHPTPHLALLSTLFGLSGIAATIVISSASIVGLAIAPRAGLATLPVALALLGAMTVTYPASRVMGRWGRRAGFSAGTAIAALGALLASLAIVRGDFLLFCVGSYLIGALGGVGSYYRFAAMELVKPEMRARAVSAVLLGGIFAGLVGPPLGAASDDLITGGRFAGSYLLLVVLDLLIILLLPFAKLAGRVPPPPHAERRSIGHIVSDPVFRAAALASIVAFAVMVLTMVSAPLSLAHVGHDSATAWVIQAHVVAMYLPSLFSGRLVVRLGTGRMMAIGLAGFAACIAVNLAGEGVANHWLALVLLGLGWNFLFVAGTTHLARAHGETDKASVQGLNDLLVSSTAALAALGAGLIFGQVGWRGLNLVAGVVVVLAGLALARLMRAPKRLINPLPSPPP